MNFRHHHDMKSPSFTSSNVLWSEWRPFEILRLNPLYDEARVLTNCVFLSIRNEEKQLYYSEFNTYPCFSTEGDFCPQGICPCLETLDCHEQEGVEDTT